MLLSVLGAGGPRAVPSSNRIAEALRVHRWGPVLARPTCGLRQSWQGLIRLDGMTIWTSAEPGLRPPGLSARFALPADLLGFRWKPPDQASGRCRFEALPVLGLPALGCFSWPPPFGLAAFHSAPPGNGPGGATAAVAAAASSTLSFLLGLRPAWDPGWQQLEVVVGVAVWIGFGEVVVDVQCDGSGTKQEFVVVPYRLQQQTTWGLVWP